MRTIAVGRTARRILVGASAFSLAIPATAAALPVEPFSSLTGVTHTDWVKATRAVTSQRRFTRTARERGCKKLFTVKMGEGAANLIYSGHGQVSRHALGVLSYIERCQRNPATEGFVRGYAQSQSRRHHARVVASHSSGAAQALPAEDSGGSTGWAIPSSVVQCESGGRNLPPNSAGASGYYQIIPGTWQAYGGGRYAPSAYQATARQQAVIAARIWDGGAGANQWVCAGGR
jgi:Transglycosylase-like domain